MQEMYREEFWRKRGYPRELYPDAASKDALVPPDLPVTSFPADVFQSRHPDTTARCFYTCSQKPFGINGNRRNKSASKICQGAATPSFGPLDRVSCLGPLRDVSRGGDAQDSINSSHHSP